MTGLIILAAGASNRLGRPKQNLIYKGETLLQRAVNTALASKCRPVMVLLGANAEAIQPNLDPDKVTILFNRDWESGMASSIKIGISKVAKDKEIDSIVIMLCDQPFVTSDLIDTLIRQKATTGMPIIASSYNNILGVPVLFDRSIFPKLEALQGDEGARLILKNQPQEVLAVEFDKAAIDIDTVEDYRKLDIS